MPGPYLLDVNVLIALFDDAHVHHAAAHEWFLKAKALGWRTCPLTENGVLRILSHPGYPNQPLPISEISARLEEFKAATSEHGFWNDDFSASTWLSDKKLAVGSANLTDAYLLKLAENHRGSLATFDRRLKPALIQATGDALVEQVPG